jgi:signal transduction histidine kinase
MKNPSYDFGSFAVSGGKFGRIVGIDHLFRIVSATFYLILIFEGGSPMGIHREVSIVLVVYLIQLIVVAIAQSFWPALKKFQRKGAVWTDLAFFFALNSVGPVSIFNVTFLWVAFMIGFRWGLKDGKRMLAVNLILYTISEALFIARYVYHGKPSGRFLSILEGIDAERGTLLAASLIATGVIWFLVILTFGYFLARWGDSERRELSREALVRRIRQLLRHGMGINVFCNLLLKELSNLLEVSQAQIILFEKDGRYLRRRLYRENGMVKVKVEELSEGGIGRSLAAKNTALPLLFLKTGDEFNSFQLDESGWNRVEVRDDNSQRGAGRFRYSTIALPLAGTNGALFGRLVLCADEKRQLGFEDILFLQKLLAVVGLFLDNLRLMDETAEEAATTERRKIALDIHDRVIQPYVAVQMGITGLRNKFESENGLGETDFERLIRISNDGVTDLREIVSQLKGADNAGQAFIPAVRRFLFRFSDVTGIAVDFQHDGIANGLYGEFSTDLFQMIAEGISNVYRHSESPIIKISLTGRGKRILLVIEDEGGMDEDVGFFIPKSLSERADLRGGFVSVSHGTVGGGVKVTIDLPAPEMLVRNNV